MLSLDQEWLQNEPEDLSSLFYSREETIESVKTNFDFRRFYSAEGYSVTVNGQTDNCLIQTPSSPFREYDDQRKIHAPLTMKINRGDYVLFDNKTWMVDTNVVNVDGAYWSTRMVRCQYKLRWQNDYGEIVERYVYSQNASAYNNGVRVGDVITLGTDQMMVFLPFDDETVSVQRGKLFYLDNNLTDPRVYELTRPDRVTYVTDGVGQVNWLLTEARYTSTEKDLEMWIPEYKDVVTIPDPPISGIASVITSDSNFINIGIPKKIYGKFIDANGQSVALDAKWSIDSPYADRIRFEVFPDYLLLTVNDMSLDGFEILVVLSADNASTSQRKFTITTTLV